MKKKFYVVWVGKETGIFDAWDTAKKQIEGFPGAKYKSFESRAEAETAFQGSPHQFFGKTAKPTKLKLSLVGKPLYPSLAVDAAWNTATGVVEYQGVLLPEKKKIFEMGPFQDGTNNIGEFLAIVHGLALLKQNSSTIPLYSDSRTAIAWVRNKTAKTKLVQNEKNTPLFELLERAEVWLKNNAFQTKILKWETEAWGENPADFGRK